MNKYKFKNKLIEFSGSGKPIFGTCAGLIMLASEIIGEEACLGLIDVKVQRNAYGRQIDSFEGEVSINLNHKDYVKR